MRDEKNPTMFRSTDDVRDWAAVQAKALNETAEVIRATVPGLIRAFSSKLRDACGMGEVQAAVVAGAIVRPLLVVAESVTLSASGVQFFITKMERAFSDPVREAEALAARNGSSAHDGLKV